MKRGFLVGLAAGALVAGCGQDQAPSSKPKPGTAEAGKPPAAPAAGDAALQRWIAGSYMSYSGSTYRRFVLAASGQFAISTESSYSGRAGEVGGAWGAAAQKGSTGRWSISGDKNRGRIDLVYNDGKRKTVNYQRGRENGVFSFDGITFAYEGPAK